MTIEHWLSGVSGENARAGLKPDTRNLKPMLGESFRMPNNVQKEIYFHSKLRGLESLLTQILPRWGKRSERCHNAQIGQ